ncbi:MAG: DegT/DnrJ/EryC1/StrS aminotransferase family protein [Verrucomicrobiota bacterium]
MFWKLQENIISDKDIEILVDFIRHTQRFTQFTEVREFEAEWSAWQGCRYSVMINSGSSANLLMVALMKELKGWQDGDEIIVPAVTWPTTLTPVMQMGLKPVFVDTNLQDLSFNYDQLAKKITSRTRGIFLVHLLGFAADLARIKSIIGSRDIEIMEDCCEATGATYQGSKVGNHGAGGTFSFYWGHHMTTVEGGMLCTNREDVYRLAILKRSHGLARELPAQFHPAIKAQYPDIDFSFLFLTDGFNIRSTEFNAVLGKAQLKKLDDFIRIRNRNYTRFLSICREYPNDLLTVEGEGRSSFTLPFFFRDAAKKTAFEQFIRQQGIESRPLISGNLLRQPFLKRYYVPSEFPNADYIHANAFYIGNNQFVNDDRLDVLEKLMRQFFTGK